MKKWKYKSYNHRLSDKQLNELGESGWELVSHSAVGNNYGFIQYYVFKREFYEDDNSEA